jgi:hypothetical protein
MNVPEEQLSSLRSAVHFTLSEPPYLSVRRSPQPLVLVMSLFIGPLVLFVASPNAESPIILPKFGQRQS